MKRDVVMLRLNSFKLMWMDGSMESFHLSELFLDMLHMLKSISCMV